MAEAIFWTCMLLVAYYHGRSSVISEQINKKQYRRHLRNVKRGHDVDFDGTTSITLKTNNE